MPEELHEYYYLAKTAVEKCRNRKIVTWTQSKTFESILKDYFGKEVAFSIAKSNSKINNETVFSVSKIERKSNEFYIVALDPKDNITTYKMFSNYGYKEVDDFICRYPSPIVLKEFDCATGAYSDAYGNTIEGYTGKLGKIVFRGGNNHIIIGDKVTGTQNLTFDLTANSYIEIREENKFTSVNRFITKGYNGRSEVIIQKGCRLTDALYRLYNNEHVSSILINEECTFETDLELHANSGKKIVIGRDCMFSHDVDLWAGDGHSIFDVTTGENVNSVYENQPPYRNAIIIGEHVWVSKGAFIMHGTNIGNGSIVGAKSVVKGQFSNNCTISGNPAHVVKQNTAWSRDMVTSDQRRCGKKDYFALSSNAKASISGMKVLVIGGTRFMGVQLVQQLIALGNDVTIATRGYAKDNYLCEVKRIIMDVHNIESVRSALEGKYYDIVFDNLASCSTTVNNILSNLKCNRYVQLSSIAVYKKRVLDLLESDFDVFKEKAILKDIVLDYSSSEYGVGKRLAESYLYQNFGDLSAVTVRIPYVVPTERIYFYTSNIVKGIPISIADMSRSFTAVRDDEVGKFLCWIAAQPYKGAINFSSDGFVTVGSIISYIEKKTGIKALISEESKIIEPFREKSFSLNLDKVRTLGYKISNINDWFWIVLDRYIERALKEKCD